MDANESSTSINGSTESHENVQQNHQSEESDNRYFCVAHYCGFHLLGMDM